MLPTRYKRPWVRRAPIALLKPVFRRSPFWRDLQQREITTSSSKFKGAGGSQGKPFSPPYPPSQPQCTFDQRLGLRPFLWYASDNPFVLEDEKRKPGEAGAFIKVTSEEPRTGTAPLLRSHYFKASHGVSRSADLSWHRSSPAFVWTGLDEDNYEAATIASLSCAITPTPST